MPRTPFKNPEDEAYQAQLDADSSVRMKNPGSDSVNRDAKSDKDTTKNQSRYGEEELKTHYGKLPRLSR